jgi:N-acetylglutamate synthase-like GNAT family acetyltransferase
MNLQNHEIQKIKSLIETYKQVHQDIEELEKKLTQLEKQRKFCVTTLANMQNEEESLVEGIAIRNNMQINEAKEKLIQLLMSK